MYRRRSGITRFTVPLTVSLIALFGAFVVQVQAEFGTNWTGSFYNTVDLSGPVLFMEAFPYGLNVNWGSGSPAPGVINGDNWSARFDSVQTFDAGLYHFVVASDDGVRIFIDDVLALDRFVGRTLTTDEFYQTMTAGPHTLRVEYLEVIDQAALQFQWFLTSADGGTPSPVIGIVDPGDGRIGYTPDEYYEVYCAHDQLEVWRGVPIGVHLATYSLSDLLSFAVGDSLTDEAGMTIERLNDAIYQVSGTNGNLAPAGGYKQFSMADCLVRNGGAPAEETPTA
ncbi:MAG: PA14 domain-containing protein [Anaerolineae bacterium]